jgi:prefoldin subunit 5
MKRPSCNEDKPTTESIIEFIGEAIADADKAKAIAQEAIANLDEGLTQLDQLADAVLEKYELL